jgi:dephospho-CoA kinase
MTKIFFGVTGLPATGKSTVGKHLQAEHGFFTLEGSRAIAEVNARKEQLILCERADYSRVFHAEQGRSGLDWITQRLLNESAYRRAHIGMRSRYEAETLRSNGGVLIATTCDIDTILADRIHMNDTKRPQNHAEYAQHVALDNALGNHLNEVIAGAEYIIDTRGMISDTHNQVDAIIETLTT